MLSISGYSIKETLYNGSRTVVYRAIRDYDGESVVIKLLNNPYPTFNELLQFRNQYIISKNLDIPGIVIPYSLEPYQNSCALVMEDMKGISLHEYMYTGNLLSLIDILSIFIQVIDIIHHIHKNSIIHKDIKPANILINPETKQVKIIDFSISSLLPKETQVLINPNILEGTLGYISPEQTGRMNRGIDYRSDFYSFGITFYELLTEQLPFNSDDVMELVHCHIAKNPPAINDEKIPPVVSDIIMKLMAKNAEDRYQSALGIKSDLEKCLYKLKTTGKIQSFPIAQNDACDRFIIYEKLYGRDKEIKILLDTFERVSHPQQSTTIKSGAKGSEMILVAGFSGIGKTALINEVHKPIVKERGYFIKGKFDQFSRNIPFSAFVQAFRNLMTQLLSETDAQLLTWKNRILQALGSNAQLIIEVVPELEKIIGKQLVVEELSGAAAQNRFNLLLQKFIQVFTTKEHPLVIFLDDLQWADSASLKMMQLLMSESSTNYLLIIGAYRDNEVDATHPLILSLNEISKLEVVINTVNLLPLEEKNVNKLVADTLNCSLEIAQPLTQLVYQKTKGNPFFINQFLKSLYQDNLIQFDFNNGSWICNISQIKLLAITDDIVEFMANQIQKLPNSTQEILKLAACIGNEFDLDSLAIISQQSKINTASALWKALQEGIIVPQNEIYKFYIGEEKLLNQSNSEVVSYNFLHDRVQQAAYSLICEGDKKITHLQIGKRLLNNTNKNHIEENIFQIINHLNIGIELITSEKQLTSLIYLNLIAARKTRISCAYEASSKYCEIGLNLISPDAWQKNYKVTLELYLEAANSACLNGEFELVEKLVETIEKNTSEILHQVKAIAIRIQSLIAQNQLPKAIEVARNILKTLEIELPENPNQETTQEEIAKIQQYMAGIEDITQLPQMRDKYKLAAMKILSNMASAAYIGSPALYPLIILRQIELSLKFGNTQETGYAYSTYGLILCAFAGEIADGNQSADIALTLMEKFKAYSFKAKIFNLVYPFVRIWRDNLAETFIPLLEGYQAGLESGDLEFAAYCAYNHCQLNYFAGIDLIDVKQKMEDYRNAIAKLKQTTALNFQKIVQQVVLNWLGENDDPQKLIGTAYDETEGMIQHQAVGDSYSIGTVYLNKLIFAYHFGSPEICLQITQATEKVIAGVAGTINFALFYFYRPLAQLAILGDKETVTADLEKLTQWAIQAPGTFTHKCDLVLAEQCRVLRDNYQAGDYYDKAISGAKANKYTQEEGLANELAAKFYLELGKETMASSYMQEAYYCYARWGAKAKTDDLEKRYSQLLQPILQNQNYSLGLNITQNQNIDKSQQSQSIQTTRYTTSTSDNLDFYSIIKSTQTLSSEIELERLISKLMGLVIENAGAQKAALLLFIDNQLILKAIAKIHEHIKLMQLPYQNSPDIPIGIINYVKNSLEKVIINDTQSQINCIPDEYFILQKPLSILCIPILNQGKLIGLLYLENNLATGAFTENKIEILNLLITQSAISLENAQLYEKVAEYSHTLEKKVEERTFELTQRTKELIHVTRLKDEFLANMSHELRTPLNAILGMTEGLFEGVFGEVTQQQRKPLETIERSGSHLLELINDILDVSKIESGKLELDLENTTVTSLCTSSVSFIKQQAYNKRIQVEIQPSIELPNILIDKRRIRQVLINLLNNAVKFTPEGGKITLSLSLIKPKDNQSQHYLRFAVSDTGIGIATEDIKKLFQPFIQIDSALNRKYTGTGLGLALVKRIVELHGGQVNLTSEIGVGSCFSFDLPYVEKLLSLPQLESKLETDIDSSQILPKTSALILLAEDNEANQSTVSNYLEAKGYRLILAENGQEAIELAQSQNPDLILMDIQMPVMDGFEAIEHIRKNKTLVNVPIIALTALAMKGDREKCLAKGANDYLSKPVKLKQLASKIQQALTS